MRTTAFHIVAAALLTSAPVMAQNAAAPAAVALVLKAGMTVRTADGKTIGRVDKVEMRNGQAVGVSVIFNQRFIHIPASTLSSSAKGLVTSLSRQDVAQPN